LSNFTDEQVDVIKQCDLYAFNQLMSGKLQDVLVGPFIDYLNDFFYNESNITKVDLLFTHDARLAPLKN